MPGDTLRDPVSYPNWMWVVGVVLALAAVVWVVAWVWRWWRSEASRPPELLTIDEGERRRYLGLIDEISERTSAGDLDRRGMNLAVAGLMRALGTQRTGRDLEVATVEEVAALVPTWPELIEVLRETARPSFEGETPQAGSLANEERVRALAQAAVCA